MRERKSVYITITRGEERQNSIHEKECIYYNNKRKREAE